MGPGDLDKALCGVDIPTDPNVLAGIEGSEDAGVYLLDENTALVQTIDFFTPIVDDPETFGMAAAANSLSDVYAMGGKPLTALNVVCYPISKLGVGPLRKILAGGAKIMREANVALVGGHSVEDDEPKYGLSVTGVVHPDRIMRNSGLQPGDKILLTKAVGTGLIATALKGSLASEGAIDAMVRSICTLNKVASEVAAGFNVKACTDVTGFGLAGHLAEMARASGCAVTLRMESVPALEGAMDAASMGLVPAGAHSNRNFFGGWCDIRDSVAPEKVDLAFDPQTSGGLILGVPGELSGELLSALKSSGVEIAAEVGEVTRSDPGGRVEIV